MVGVPPIIESQEEAAPAAPWWLLVAAEVALVLLSGAGVIGLSRLFDDSSFLLPVLAFSLAGHGLAIACRRLGIRPGPSSALCGLALVAALAWFLLGETTTFGLPGAGTWTQAGRELSAALEVFRQVVAPAPVEPGFVLAAAIAVWVTAVVADMAVFRSGARVEAAIPATTLFVFGAVLGAPDGRLALSALFLAAVALYWLTQRLLIHAEAPNRMAVDTSTAPRSILRSGGLLGAAAVVVALVIGPLLPGAEADAVVAWRSGDGDGGGSRVTVSPLVDIRSRIVDQSDIEVFQVDADTRSYWRLTSLEIFDGNIWSSRGQYRQVDGRFPDSVPAEQAATRVSVASFEIAGLSSIWLPAPYRAVGIDGTDARFDPDSASILTEEETATGLAYQVRSEIPVLDAASLGQALGPPPEWVAATSTGLPSDFSPTVSAEARRIVEGTTSPYEAALALQTFFRDGSFTYDLSIPPGHGGNALERFLFETRRGYCEQFAGAFAAMARSVGLPARVAVGFTPGEEVSPGSFLVRGLNAHAWPEVFLAGYGWIAFEPTPGRGMPGAEAYTGVPEQQATPGDPSTATTRPPAAAAAPTTTLAGGESEPGADTAASGQGGGASWLGPVAAAVALPLVAFSAWWAILAALRHRRRQRRRHAATTAAEQVLVTWAEAGDALGELGCPPRSSETPIEFAQRAAGTTGIDQRLLKALAGATTAAGYSPSGVSDDIAAQAKRAGSDLRRAVDDAVGLGGKFARSLDPRPLLPERNRRLEIRNLSPLASRGGANGS